MQTLLSIHALSPFTKSLLLKSTDHSSPSTDVWSLLCPLWSVLTTKLEFTVHHGCCVCLSQSSALRLTRVEAVADPVAYNVQKLRLSARSPIVIFTWVVSWLVGCLVGYIQMFNVA